MTAALVPGRIVYIIMSSISTVMELNNAEIVVLMSFEIDELNDYTLGKDLIIVT